MGIGPGPTPQALFQVNPIIEVEGTDPTKLTRQDLEYTLYGAGYNTSDLTSLLRIDSGFKEIGNELLYEISNIDICSTYGNKFTDIFDKPVEITKIGKSAFKHTFCTSNLDFSGWDQLTTIDDEAFSNDIGPLILEISGGGGAIGLIPSVALAIIEGDPNLRILNNTILNGESVGLSKQRFDYRLGSINFSNTPSLQYIGQQAFCYGGISGPLDFSGLNSLQEIGKGAFLINSNFYNGYYNPVTASFEVDFSFSSYNSTINIINFNNCPSLQTIGEYAFWAVGLNKGLINFENLPSLTNICKNAFGSNLSFELSGGTIQPSVLNNTISFKNCPKLKTIGQGAFSGAGISGPLDLSELTALTDISDEAFLDNNFRSVNFTNCNSLQTIGNSAFYSTGISADLELSDLSSLKYIGNYAFQDSSINSLSIKNCPSLQYIGANAFSNNEIRELNLSNLPLLTKLINECFDNNNINDISIVDCSLLNTFEAEVFDRNPLSGSLTLRNVPSLTNFPHSVLSTDSFEDSLELTGTGFTEITDDFSNGTFGGSLTINDNKNLTTINAKAFKDNSFTSLELTRNTSLTTISNEAFAENNFINGIDFTNNINLETIGEKAFYNSEISGVIDFSGISSLIDICSQVFDGSQNITQFRFFENSGLNIGQNVCSLFNDISSSTGSPEIKWDPTGFQIPNSGEYIWTNPTAE